MQVTFTKLIEQRASTWDAVWGKNIRVPGARMALGRGDLPHDLLQLVVEGTVGVDDGFWACVAAGATFRSTGRKRTRPGKAVIAAHRKGLDAAEQTVGAHVQAWRTGTVTPAGAALDRFDELWRSLGDGGSLCVEWPSLRVDQASVSQAKVSAALHEKDRPPMPAASRGS
jgi:hypothetical protein